MKPLRVILLAARGIPNLPRKSGHAFHTSLEWILHSLRENGVREHQITLIGGKDIDDLAEKYPRLHFLFNPDWEHTGTMHSLNLAVSDLKEPCIVSYVDVVYRPSVIRTLLKKKKGDITVVADTLWWKRYPNRSTDSLKKAEKLWLDDTNRVLGASRSLTHQRATAELAGGLLYLTPRGARSMCSTFTQLKKQDAIFMDVFSTLLKKNQHIHSVSIDGGWAELDEPQDFGRFIFGTKAQTLDRIRPLLKHGTILPQYTFTVQLWQSNPKTVLDNIRDTFHKEKTLVVRSSSICEDSLQSSYAGAFTSCINVPKKEKTLTDAIEKVIESFGRSNDEDQILIQPHITHVSRAGVIFTCDIRTGAPYYVINDDKSGKTDTITGGKSDSDQLYYVSKKHLPTDPHLRRLVHIAQELEQLTGNEAIDIEFAVDTHGTLFIFQTRPITNREAITQYYHSDIQPCLIHAQAIITKRLKPRPHLAGSTSILGDMPDWNPAELIGSHPRPLASSLFHELITKSAWREARRMLGYCDPSPEELMLLLAGHPYIDVRNSLNSFTPASLDPSVREKLVDESLSYLKQHPSAHDKIEFEVATTCFSPFFEERNSRWKNAGFTTREITALKQCFLEHTESIISGTYFSIPNLLHMVHSLDHRRTDLLDQQNNFLPIDLLRFLLDDCRVLGTIPFSALARMAFIGNTFLKGFLHKKAIDHDAYHGFLQSIITVAGEMQRALSAVNAGNMTLSAFLKTYGHLRPGTYEITAYRYDEQPDLYFAKTNEKKRLSHHSTTKRFQWTAAQKRAMQAILKTSGMHLTIQEVLDFTAAAIAGREEAKFIFSRNVSDLLSLITTWGERQQLSREDLSFLHIHHLLIIANLPDRPDTREFLAKAIAIAKEEYQTHQQIIMPQLITDPKDIECISSFVPRPNFITTKCITKQSVVLHQTKGKESIHDKIVLIESADPGYDWIFTHGIAGLITKYGGAASHMAIRSAEFGLPAAIGVGAQFEGLSQKQVIHLDCGNKTIS